MSCDKSTNSYCSATWPVIQDGSGAGTGFPFYTSGCSLDLSVKNNYCVFQTVNSQPTLFVSPFNVIDTVVEGFFALPSTVDDDMFGFVIGTKVPTGKRLYFTMSLCVIYLLFY